MGRMLSIEEQEELDRLVEKKDYCEILMLAGIVHDKEGSVQGLEQGYAAFRDYLDPRLGDEGRREFSRILGSAHTLMHHLADAAVFFMDAQDKDALVRTFDLARTYGRHDVV